MSEADASCFLAEARHENFHAQRTQRSRIAKPVRTGAVTGKAQTAIRCRLCQETIVLESNFRPTAATCPHCGLKFVFDPQQEPLPVRGLRLRYSAVREAQRRPGAVQHKRHRRPRAARHPSSPAADELSGLGRRSGPLRWLRPSRFTAVGFTGCWRGRATVHETHER